MKCTSMFSEPTFACLFFFFCHSRSVPSFMKITMNAKVGELERLWVKL